MKKNRLAAAWAVVLSAAVTLSSCVTTEASAPAAAPAAAAVPKASAPMVVSDFEDPTRDIGTFAGPKSKVTTEYQTQIVHGGKSALKVTEQTADWTGALLVLTADNGDWGAYSKLHFWVYGTKTGQYFNVDLEDKGAEQFRYSIANDFQGWKEFIIPFTDFPVRSDYQAANASRNGHIDWPLKTIQFFTASSFSGFLVFDDMTVDP